MTLFALPVILHSKLELNTKQLRVYYRLIRSLFVVALVGLAFRIYGARAGF